MKTIWLILAISATALVLNAFASPAGNVAALPGTKWELVAWMVLHPCMAHRSPCSLGRRQGWR